MSLHLLVRRTKPRTVKMMNRRKFLVTTAAALPVAAIVTPAFAAKPPVFQSGGVAINGYDPVAYFTEGKPVEGSPEFTSDWDGAVLQFVSAENKALYDADPIAYAPAYGGYCAYAVSKGYTASTDPKAWSIYENRLFLNYSRSVRALWSLNKAERVASGDANWPSVLSA